MLLPPAQNPATGGKPCPLTAWASYWRLRSHGIPVARDKALESACRPVLEAAYGKERVAALEVAGLLEQPLFININKAWCAAAAGAGRG